MNSLLRSCNPVGFVPITNAARAKAFYSEILGLQCVSEELPFALVFDANGIMLRLTMLKELPNYPSTVFGWSVHEIANAVDQLEQGGVKFERYGLPGQDERGVWTTPTGSKVAWFKDSEGNTLSISEHPEWKV